MRPHLCSGVPPQASFTFLVLPCFRSRHPPRPLCDAARHAAPHRPRASLAHRLRYQLLPRSPPPDPAAHKAHRHTPAHALVTPLREPSRPGHRVSRVPSPDLASQAVVPNQPRGTARRAIPPTGSPRDYPSRPFLLHPKCAASHASPCALAATDAHSARSGRPLYHAPTPAMRLNLAPHTHPRPRSPANYTYLPSI